MGIDILIPVLGRPASAQKVVDSVTSATEGDFRILFLCSHGDREEIDACLRTPAEVCVCPWPADQADWARKINFGFDITHEEWIFTGADDLVFYEGWDSKALALADGASVIGTNDLHNPLVLRRGHATHMLIRRSYIEEQGGTVDGTGKVFCELYDHQYTDMEFCQTAIRRGVWRFAEESIVEHMHPHWGLAEMDATYDKSMRHVTEDVQLYQERLELLAKQHS